MTMFRYAQNDVISCKVAEIGMKGTFVPLPSANESYKSTVCKMDTIFTHFPTYNPDIDREILIRLDTESIYNVQNTYKYIDNLITPLFWKQKFIHDYVDLGFNINYEDLYKRIEKMDGATIYEFAKQYRYPKLMDWVLSDKKASQEYYTFELIKAISENNIDKAKQLLEKDINIDTKNTKLIHFTIRTSNMNMIKLMLDNGIDPTLMLIDASLENNSDIINLILSYGADVAVNDNAPLINATELGNYSTIHTLLENGADVHARNDQIILAAVGYGDPDVLDLLIEYGANIHAYDNNPLIIAINNGYIDIIIWLLAHGMKITREELDKIEVTYWNKESVDYVRDNMQ